MNYRYSDDRWWWECVVVIRKLCIIFLSSLLYNDALQVQLTLGVLLVAYVLHHVFLPFAPKKGEEKSGELHGLERNREKVKDERNKHLLHVLERNSILVSTLLLWAATVFIVSTSCEHGFCYILVVAVFVSNVGFLSTGLIIYVRLFLDRNKRIGELFEKNLFQPVKNVKKRLTSFGTNNVTESSNVSHGQDSSNDSNDSNDSNGGAKLAQVHSFFKMHANPRFMSEIELPSIDSSSMVTNKMYKGPARVD